jgi:hypothetical protein
MESSSSSDEEEFFEALEEATTPTSSGAESGISSLKNASAELLAGFDVNKIRTETQVKDLDTGHTYSLEPVSEAFLHGFLNLVVPW